MPGGRIQLKAWNPVNSSPDHPMHDIFDTIAAQRQRRPWRRLALRVALLAAIAAFSFWADVREKRDGAGRGEASSRASFAWPAMGTVAEFEAAGDSAAAGRMRNVVADAIAEVEDELSAFITNSVVFHMNRGETVEVPDHGHSATVIRFALEMAEASGGAFDPTVGRLMRLWGFRGVSATLTLGMVSNAVASAGWWHVSVRPAGKGRVAIDAGGAEIDLGAIAKGYAVDLAFERLAEANCTDFLINLGGNIRVSGSPEAGRSEWNIAVRDPSGSRPPAPLPRPLRDGEAVATSGSYERFVEINGRRYSHIIDPRTGLPVDNGLGSVSVIAPTAMEADALSTTLFVLGREAGSTFISARPGCTAVFIDSKL